MTPDESSLDHTLTGQQPHEYVIIGGGIHGTCVANYLLAEGGFTRDEVRIIDPCKELLASFETKAEQCGMKTLRSTFVQHIDTEPFSLESFAEGDNREHDLVSTEHYPNRPTLDLFVDHAQHVIDRRSIDDCHLQSRATGLTETEGRETLQIRTDVGSLEAHRVVLAIGLGAQPTVPEWATALPADAPFAHVWDSDFDPEAAATFDGETYVVGGGITAGQLACRLSRHTDVTLLSRHDLEIELTEADAYWLNWGHIEQEIHTLPPGSKARLDRIRDARNDGMIPPYAEHRLDEARRCDDLYIQRGEISSAYATDDGLHPRTNLGVFISDSASNTRS